MLLNSERHHDKASFLLVCGLKLALTFSRLKEALTIKDEKAIAKIIFTLIDDEELVQALIKDLENCLIELEESEEEL